MALDADIVAGAEQTAIAAVFAFASNRINISSQNSNVVTGPTQSRPIMGRPGARGWTKGSSRAHRYEDRFRVCPLIYYSVRKSIDSLQ
jgi:hypothetical protein